MRDFPISIWVYTFCHNNAKILPIIIPYWQSYASNVIVYDFHSTDNSLQILSQYKWIKVRQVESQYYDPDTIQILKSSIYKEAISHADFVQVSDIDEVLLYSDSLFPILQSEKAKHILYFKPKYYNVISKSFPQITSEQSHLLPGVFSLLNNKITNRILLFNPTLNIIFQNYQDDFIIDDEFQEEYSYIQVLQFKMLGLEYFQEQQMNFLNGLDPEKTYQHIYRYGSSMDNCISIFNYYSNQLHTNRNKILKIDQEISKQITSNIIISNAQLEQKNDNYIPKIEYNNMHDNKDCVVIIPIYNTLLSAEEEICLSHLFQILNPNWDIILLGKQTANLNSINLQLNTNFNFLQLNISIFNKTIFKDLLDQSSFYKYFKEYNYLLIAESTCYFLQDDIHRYILYNFDCVNSPDINEELTNIFISFRNIHKFIEQGSISCDCSFDAGYRLCINENAKKQWKKLPMIINKPWEAKSIWKKYIDFEQFEELKQKSKNSKIALCAIVKNENLYIEEWIKYYKTLGINKIFIYDNNDINGENLKNVIFDYIQDGFVEIIDIRGQVKTVKSDKNGQTMQGLAYKSCYEEHFKEYEWICFFDIDEFLEIEDHISLKDFLLQDQYKDVDGLRIQWRTYGDNGQLYYEDCPIIERFKAQSNMSYDKHFKTIIHTINYKNDILFCAHGPINKDLFIPNVKMKKVSNYYFDTQIYNDLPIYLNHFYSKSMQEFIERKLYKTSAVTGINYNRNYSIQFLTNQYFEHNIKTDKKLQVFNTFIEQYKSVDVYIATIWRNGFILKTLKSIIHQPEVNHIYISANIITDEQIGLITTSFSKDKITIYKTNNEKGSNEKLKYINEGTAKYIAFCDDDLIYPSFYFNKMINACEQLNNPVSYHGSVFTTFPLEHYYAQRKVWCFDKTIKENKIVDTIGNGVSLFKRSYLSKEDYSHLYEIANEVSMDDILISYMLRNAGYSLYVISHNSNDIIEKKKTEEAVFLMYKNNDQIQTDWANTYFKNLMNKEV